MPGPPRFRIVAATANPDKLARLRELVGPVAVLLGLPSGVTIEEPSGEEPSREDPIAGSANPLPVIAAAKAVSVSHALGGALTIATDGGLVVPALGADWQAATTRRFAGAGATNRLRAGMLLALAADLTGDDRRIVWREAVAVARDGRVLLSAVAESRPGTLATDLGDRDDEGQGFWVPSLWRSQTDPARSASTGDEHWARLALLVTPFLSGLTD